MKQVTRKELRRVIKEEAQKVLDEWGAEKVVDEAFGLGTGTTPAQRAGFGKPSGPGGVGSAAHDPEQVAITDEEKAEIAAALDRAGIGDLKSKIAAALGSLVPTSGRLEESDEGVRSQINPQWLQFLKDNWGQGGTGGTGVPGAGRSPAENVVRALYTFASQPDDQLAQMSATKFIFHVMQKAMSASRGST